MNFDAQFFYNAINRGTAPIVIDPNSSETIDGRSTFTLGLGEAVRVFCDGTGFYTDASRGKLVELARVTNPNAATVDFDFSSGWPSDFSEFEVYLEDVSPATDDVYLGMRIKTTASLTVQTSGYLYGARNQGAGGGADMGATIDSVSDRIALTRPGTGLGIGNATGEVANAIVAINAPNSTKVKQARFTSTYNRSSDGVVQYVDGAGYYGSTSAWTGIRFLMSSGNIASGTFVLYGRRK